MCEPHTNKNLKNNYLKLGAISALAKNTALAPAMLLAAGLVLAGCATGTSDDSLTEPVTGNQVITPEVDESESSTEPFPFAEGLVFSPLSDCQEALEEAIALVLGSEPAVISLGDDGSGTIVQQMGVVGTEDDATSIFETFDGLIGQGQCMLDSGTGVFGETVGRDNLTGLPDGAQGIRWETNYVNAQTESCDEYAERREFWLVQVDTDLYVTAAGWFGCSVESEFPNDVSFEEIREQAADAHEAMMGRL